MFGILNFDHCDLFGICVLLVDIFSKYLAKKPRLQLPTPEFF